MQEKKLGFPRKAEPVRSLAGINDVNKSTNNVHKNMERMLNGHKLDVRDMFLRSTREYRMYTKETVMLQQRL